MMRGVGDRDVEGGGVDILRRCGDREFEGD